MPTKKTKYTGVKVRCMVKTIEFVVPIHEDENPDYLNRALDSLREIGAAEVVETMAICEEFDEACEILYKHREQ